MLIMLVEAVFGGYLQTAGGVWIISASCWGWHANVSLNTTSLYYLLAQSIHFEGFFPQKKFQKHKEIPAASLFFY